MRVLELIVVLVLFAAVPVVFRQIYLWALARITGWTRLVAVYGRADRIGRCGVRMHRGQVAIDRECWRSWRQRIRNEGPNRLPPNHRYFVPSRRPRHALRATVAIRSS